MNLHSCWILLSKSTGPAVAQHLIAEVRFAFPICFHFHQKIEINFVVWLLMVSATINHFCCLQQCTNPDDYAQRVRVLSKYHVRDIHDWDEGGSCNFHPARTCRCKKCEEDQVECTGEPYKTKTPLKCDFHWLVYRIEGERRADEADSVIHPEMGRGNSNLCEASFTVLPQFRYKSQSLCRYDCMLQLL